MPSGYHRRPPPAGTHDARSAPRGSLSGGRFVTGGDSDVSPAHVEPVTAASPPREPRPAYSAAQRAARPAAPAAAPGPSGSAVPRSGLLRRLGGFRIRVALLLLAGLAVQAAGFEALLTTLAHNWLTHELHSRAHASAEQLAERTAGPLVAGNLRETANEARYAGADRDLVDIAVFDGSGKRVAGWNSGDATPAAPGDGRASGPRTFAVEAPIIAHAVAPAAGPPGTDAPPLPRPGTVLGKVRLVVSTVRMDEAVALAARMGFLMLLGALTLGFFAISALVGFAVRPLREASELAQEIAQGQLARRLPVRGDDELGALAHSMNTMAEALGEARQLASSEAGRMNTATDAVLAIAREARVTHEPREVFQLVATHVRRVAQCDGVALAVPSEDGSALEIAYLDPPNRWSVLREDEPLDHELVFRVDTVEASTRVALDTEDTEFARALRADGHRAALLVPLTLELGPPALLVLVSRNPGAFDWREAEIVAGLASHLSSALRGARLNHSLERAIAELERTRDVLVQSGMLRVAGEMASGVAHEFNNILGAILGRAQLLRRAIEQGTAEPRALCQSLEIIERVAQDGAETVRRLRLFGRAGEQATAEPMELEAVIRDSAEFTKPRWSNEALAAGRSITVEVDVAEGLWVQGRPHELREVFTNLLLNAVDAMPDGGTIRITARRSAGSAVTVIEDDGVGMSEDTRRRLFEPFFTTKGESGTGLGMSVAYGIVQRHDGTIEVSSRPGHGSRIEVSLPLTSQRPVTVPTAPTVIRRAEEPLEVLVIDDEEAVRDLLGDILRMLGHRVTTYSTGLEALSAYIPGQFQLVITDIGMPGLTGWQVAGVVRALDPDVMLAFVTGWAEDVSRDAMLQTEIEDVIAKPFTIEDVQRVIDTALARRLGRAA